jgi:hypothetical protein
MSDFYKLLYAIDTSNLKIIEDLLNKNTDITICDDFAFEKACKHNNIQIINLLLKHKKTDKHLYHLLLNGIKYNNINMIEETLTNHDLIENGLKLSITNNNIDTLKFIYNKIKKDIKNYDTNSLLQLFIEPIKSILFGSCSFERKSSTQSNSLFIYTSLSLKIYNPNTKLLYFSLNIYTIYNPLSIILLKLLKSHFI